tara:strand:+ start:1926 stop:2348 length:423 start_codon:yes stop_codon:yes gene_type:complete
MTVIALKFIIALCITLLCFQTRIGLLVSSHIALLCDYFVTVLTGQHLLLHYHVLSRIFDLGHDFSISERDLRFGFIFLDLGLSWYLTRVMKNLSEELHLFSLHTIFVCATKNPGSLDPSMMIPKYKAFGWNPQHTDHNWV